MTESESKTDSVCRNCGAESETVYRCSNCGKLAPFTVGGDS